MSRLGEQQRRWCEVLRDGIRNTTTTTGLKVEAILVEPSSQTGLKVSDDEMASLALEKHDTCPNWNYTFRPRPGRK